MLNKSAFQRRPHAYNDDANVSIPTAMLATEEMRSDCHMTVPQTIDMVGANSQNCSYYAYDSINIFIRITP